MFEPIAIWKRTHQIRQALVKFGLVLEDEGRVDGAAVPEVFVGSLLGSIL